MVPLIKVPSNTDIEPPSKETSHKLVRALQTSGFLLVESPLLTTKFQSEALHAASSFLDDDNGKGGGEKDIVISHPTDPKLYAMLKYDEIDRHVLNQSSKQTFKKYMDILRCIKMDILRHIDLGLGITNNDDSGCNLLSDLHSNNNDTLRLISYFPTNSSQTGNRCKEHSDYGTLTLLSTDGVSGLELFDSVNKCWLPVPHIEGALVVNVGSLLSGWTRGSLKATLHRVAGPGSEGSRSLREDLLEAVGRKRTSIAYFVDPNENLSELLRGDGGNINSNSNINSNNDGGNETNEGLREVLNGMSIAEYIDWRSGGSGADRSGVSFMSNEEEEMEGQKD